MFKERFQVNKEQNIKMLLSHLDGDKINQSDKNRVIQYFNRKFDDFLMLCSQYDIEVYVCGEIKTDKDNVDLQKMKLFLDNYDKMQNDIHNLKVSGIDQISIFGGNIEQMKNRETSVKIPSMAMINFFYKHYHDQISCDINFFGGEKQNKYIMQEKVRIFLRQIKDKFKDVVILYKNDIEQQNDTFRYFIQVDLPRIDKMKQFIDDVFINFNPNVIDII